MNKKLQKIVDKIQAHEGFLVTNDFIEYGLYKNVAQASYLRSTGNFPDYITKVGHILCYEKNAVIEHIINNEEYILTRVMADHPRDRKALLEKGLLNNGVDLKKIAEFEDAMSHFRSIINEEMEDLRTKVTGILGVRKGE
jgi:hypothetical protein